MHGTSACGLGTTSAVSAPHGKLRVPVPNLESTEVGGQSESESEEKIVVVGDTVAAVSVLEDRKVQDWPGPAKSKLWYPVDGKY